MVGLMHQREAAFTVPTSPDAVWRFIRDFESLCRCIPGVERLRRIDDATAELTVVEKVGVVPLRVDLTAHIDAEDPPHRLHAIATAEHVDVEIDVRLEQTAQGTRLASLVQVAGRGPLKPVVDRLFERRATERTAQFAELIEARFGGAPKTGVPAQSSKGRLTRLWQQLLEWLGLR
jgi:carbon monoxide dehydrogenase subunit G